MTLRRIAITYFSLYEIYLIYRFIDGVLGADWESLPVLCWVRFVVQVGLGYLFYRLTISGRRKLAKTAILFGVVLVIFSYVTFLVSPEGLYPYIGSPFIFVLTVNSFIVYHFVKNHEAVKETQTKSGWLLIISLILVLIGDIYLSNSIAQIGLIFMFLALPLVFKEYQPKGQTPISEK